MRLLWALWGVMGTSLWDPEVVYRLSHNQGLDKLLGIASTRREKGPGGAGAGKDFARGEGSPLPQHLLGKMWTQPCPLAPIQHGQHHGDGNCCLEAHHVLELLSQCRCPAAHPSIWEGPAEFLQLWGKPGLSSANAEPGFPRPESRSLRLLQIQGCRLGPPSTGGIGTEPRWP